ncbi:hypothetical protein [Pseudomonas marginalis]|jgi:hypothetical protein|uniref:hypothetical protein n=1 Tax=Pseudomonas marginalis TaxID=298 RepID=UPI0024800F23|nr:hypothetical protein [Pseudomonas marginalis]WGT30161.1 hypothetical protein QGQ83_10255 [Pseudomonas marginalis]
MKQAMRLVRLNLHLRADHLDRLTNLTNTISRRKGRDTRLAEALELALVTGLTWSDTDMLDLLKSDLEAPYWRTLGSVVRSR